MNSIQNVRLISIESELWKAHVRSNMSRKSANRDKSYSDLGALHSNWFEDAIRQELKGISSLMTNQILVWEEQDAQHRVNTHFRELDAVAVKSDICFVTEIKFSHSKNAIKSGLKQLDIATKVLRNRYKKVSTLLVLGNGQSYCSSFGNDEEAIKQLRNCEDHVSFKFKNTLQSIEPDTRYLAIFDTEDINNLCEKYPHPLDEINLYKEI